MITPYFSIIIPTYKRPEQLLSCLDALSRLDYPRNSFEVIVVDDDNGRGTLGQVIAPLESKLNITLLTEAHSGPSAARNNGAVRAEGTYLVFTDDDCQPAPDWLQTLAARFAAAPEHAVGGQTINALPHNPYSTSTQMMIDYLYTQFNPDQNDANFLTSNNFAVPAARFRELGGFNMLSSRAGGEDREFCDRWVYKGGKMLYAPEVIVYHTHDLTLSSYWKQHFNYGRGAYAFRQMRSEHTRDPIKVEPLPFYLNLLTYHRSYPQKHNPALMYTLLIIMQAANTAGFFWEKIQKG